MNRKLLLSAIVALVVIQICIFFFKNKEKNENSKQQIVEYFQKAFSAREKLALSLIDDKSDEAISLLSENSISVLEFSNDSLIYWSNSYIPVSTNSKTKLDSTNFLKLGNAYYFVEKKNDKYALILIKRAFKQENKHLKNSFAEGLNKFPEIKISSDVNKYETSIKDSDSKSVFSIDTQDCKYKHSYIVFYFFLFQLLFLLLFARRIVAGSDRAYALPLLAVFLACLRTFFVLVDIEHLFMDISPLNSLITDSYSLAQLIIDSSFLSVFFFSFIGSKLNYFKFISKRNELISVLTIGSIIALVSSLFVFNILQRIIVNTDISLELSRWKNVSISSYLVYVSLSFVIYSLTCGVKKLLNDLLPHSSKKDLLVSSLAILIFLAALINKVTIYAFYPSVVVLLVFVFNIISLRISRREIRRIIFLVHLFIISAVLSFFINKTIEKKIHAEQKIFANSLMQERDFGAEKLMPTLSVGIDSLISLNSDNLLKDIYSLSDSCLGNLFSISITNCSANDALIINNEEHNCLDFFNRKITKSASLVDSNFRTVSEFDGLSSYIAVFPHNAEKIIIELFSKSRNEGRGYPEILDYTSFRNKYNFSWAKYSDGKLLISSGKYNFFNHLVDTKSAQTVNASSYVYNKSFANNNILVATDSKLLSNIILNIPYLFILLCIITLVVWFYASLFERQDEFNSFSSRIRNWFIIYLLIFFFLIGGLTLYYNLDRFQRKQEDRISTLVKTLTRRLENVDLDNFSLASISDVLQSDINIYSSNGILLYTSRAEIYNKAILSDVINREALEKTIKAKEALVFNKEKISDIKYLSVYAPLVNKYQENKLIINIPYFEESNLLREEIFNQFVSGLNIYILISLLAIIIATFLAEKITRPLQLIVSRLGNVELRKDIQTIDYKQNDELGRLVREYNKMAIKLSDSVSELARSERETAWHEMAKQIAHEIKNPLTPMKLSMQHLIYTKNLESEKWSYQFDKTSTIILEQIENLSSIASSFSDFSNIATSKFEEVDVLKSLGTVKNLFSEENVRIRLVSYTEKHKVYASDSQLKRAFINIVKNSLQAMRSQELCEIEITVSTDEENFLLISFKDNGIGIAEEISGQLFEPHFTTKSSGMGLGLAITKEIILNTKGSISFESEKGKGTTFFIKLPLYS